MIVRWLGAALGTKNTERRKMAKAKNNADLRRRMYIYFRDYDGAGFPSISKFARGAGLTVAELEKFRKNPAFEKAYAECMEIRRDMIIDGALAKRADASFAKFLLCQELPESETEKLDVTLTVVE
jgi:hypothetical protein